MLTACNNTPNSTDVPILERPKLRKYVDGEMKLCHRRIRDFLRVRILEFKGNTFCQFIHDGVTPDNKQMYQSLGINFVDAQFCSNHAAVPPTWLFCSLWLLLWRGAKLVFILSHDSIFI